MSLITDEILDEENRVTYQKFEDGFEEWSDYDIYGERYIYKDSNGYRMYDRCVCNRCHNTHANSQQ